MAAQRGVKGLVVYRGPSVLDGSPIVAIVTGLRGSKNPKTGAMLQTWILREDVSPAAALVSGEDAAICGDCIHRPKQHEDGSTTRSCYVNIRAPQSVWKAYKRGAYTTYQAKHANLLRRAIRFGAYGDPAAAPYRVWAKLAQIATRRTGYTHAWRTCDQRLRKLVMASADHPDDVEVANTRGWRTFRAKLSTQSTLPNEIGCPASKEQGKRRTCLECGACKGAGNGHNVVIDMHGRKGVQEAHLLAMGHAARISLQLV